MIFRVRHHSTYHYTDPVPICHNEAHLLPRNRPGSQQVLRRDLAISPKPAVLNHRLDFYGNTVSYFCIQDPHTELRVIATSEVEVLPQASPPPQETTPWEMARELVRAELSAQGLEAYEFVFDSPSAAGSAELEEYARSSFPPGRPLLEATLDLTRRIHEEFEYLPQATTVATPISEVLARRQGVCQDFAHLMIGCLRALGLPGRYVSGYLLTTPPPGQEKLQGADASHAWVSVYVPMVGWLDLDPTNGILVSDQHITAAWGRDYNDVSPLRGVLIGGGQQTISVAVDVEAIGQPTAPAAT